MRMEDRRECSDRKIISQCRERAGRVYYGAVFEAKKEIPGYTELSPGKRRLNDSKIRRTLKAQPRQYRLPLNGFALRAHMRG